MYNFVRLSIQGLQQEKRKRYRAQRHMWVNLLEHKKKLLQSAEKNGVVADHHRLAGYLFDFPTPNTTFLHKKHLPGKGS